jgi:hypothetical protein
LAQLVCFGEQRSHARAHVGSSKPTHYPRPTGGSQILAAAGRRQQLFQHACVST